MPKFGNASLANLNSAHPDLRRLFLAVVVDYDCSVLGGVRSAETQRENVRNGLSKTMASKHLMQADGYAHAVDVAPYPLNWDSPTASLELAYFAGKVMERARAMGIRIRYGGDWNQNGLVSDNKFMDLDHFELSVTG